jgi:hypothetical protein
LAGDLKKIGLSSLLFVAVRRDSTGFASAIFRDWKLTVSRAIKIANTPAPAKRHVEKVLTVQFPTPQSP